MATIIATSINVTPLTVPCYTCHQPVVQADAHTLRLLVPSGYYRDGRELPLITRETAYECDSCFIVSAQIDNEHLYTVHTCGTTRTVSAATPEAAAVLMLQDRGWASTRSIAVIGTGARCEFLDCELVDGALQYSERVMLP